MATNLCEHNERQQDCSTCSGSPVNQLDYQPSSRMDADRYGDAMSGTDQFPDDDRRD